MKTIRAILLLIAAIMNASAAPCVQTTTLKNAAGDIIASNLADVIAAGACELGPATIQISNYQSTYGDTPDQVSISLFGSGSGSNQLYGLRIWSAWLGNGSVLFDYSLSLPLRNNPVFPLTTTRGWGCALYSWLPSGLPGWTPTTDTMMLSMSYSATVFGSGSRDKTVQLDNRTVINNYWWAGEFLGGEMLSGTVQATFTGWTGPANALRSFGQIGFKCAHAPYNQQGVRPLL